MAKKKPSPKSEEPIVTTDAFVEAANKTFGENTLITLGSGPTMHNFLYQIPTGSLGLDVAIGPMKRLPNGRWQTGLPPGRVTELKGPEGSGKTTLALQLIAEAQRQGLNTAFIDVEHALDPLYAQQLGVDLDRMHFSQPDGGEVALDLLAWMLKARSWHVIVVDSIAMLLPTKEDEGDMGDNQVGLQARLMTKMSRKITPLLGQNNNCHVVMINQIRQRIGPYGGETTPGGNALRHLFSFRIDVRPGEPVNCEEERVGHRLRMKVVKNKVAPPYRTAEASLIYGYGIDYVDELITLGEDHGVITKAGAWYTLPDGQKAQGKVQLAQVINGAGASLQYQLLDATLTAVMAERGLTPEGLLLPDAAVITRTSSAGPVSEKGLNDEVE